MKVVNNIYTTGNMKWYGFEIGKKSNVHVDETLKSFSVYRT